MSLPAGFATAVDSAIQCTSLISYVMDVHLREMRQDGFSDAAWDAHIQKVATQTCPAVTQAVADTRAAKTQGFSLTIKDMGGIFCFHGAMSALALIFAFYQRFNTSRRNPQKKLRPIHVEKAVTKVKENLEESARSVQLVSKNLHLDESIRNISRMTSGLTSRRNLHSSSNLDFAHSGSMDSVGSEGGGVKSFHWSEPAKEFGGQDDQDDKEETDVKFWAN